MNISTHILWTFISCLGKSGTLDKLQSSTLSLKKRHFFDNRHSNKHIKIRSCSTPIFGLFDNLQTKIVESYQQINTPMSMPILYFANLSHFLVAVNFQQS